MRLIDCDALKKELRNSWIRKAKMPMEADPFLAFAMSDIDNAPTIDAEPIVRCKDCRYNTVNPRLFYSKDMTMTYAWCPMIIDASNGEGFCNFAKDLESEEEE